jgi:malonyl-CoA/methylmalonyl-CoA synthetase
VTTPSGFDPLLPSLAGPAPATPALRFPEGSLTHAQLRDVCAALAPRLRGARRVAVWAEPALAAAVGVVAALIAGVPVVPLNPRSGAKELEHVLADSGAELLIAAAGAELPAAAAALPSL